MLSTTAQLPAGIGRVPAERLEAPTRPDSAAFVMEAELARSGKTDSRSDGAADEPPVTQLALGPAAYLRQELITDAVVASAPQPAATPQAGGNPL